MGDVSHPETGADQLCSAGLLVTLCFGKCLSALTKTIKVADNKIHYKTVKISFFQTYLITTTLEELKRKHGQIYSISLARSVQGKSRPECSSPVLLDKTWT